MFTIEDKVNKRKYSIEFTYEKLDVRRMTGCIVIELPKNKTDVPQIVANGQTICAPNDNFSKAVGRKISAQRAASKKFFETRPELANELLKVVNTKKR